MRNKKSGHRAIEQSVHLIIGSSNHWVIGNDVLEEA